MIRALVLCLSTLLAACGAPRAPSPDGLVTFPSFGDLDPHPWPGRAPSDYAVHGIDVSKFQQAIDWPAVRAAGISFAFIKATEGGDLLDERFEENWQAARRAGIPRSAYHFFYWCRPAAEQAAWYIRHVPRDPRALPPVLDLEWTPFSPTCTIRPPGEVVRREAETFLRIVERHYGKRPIVYTSPDIYRDADLGRLRGVTFWLRSVAGHPSDIYPPGARWTFWQYTGTGLVPGVSGGVDINVFRGAPEEWLAFAR